MSSVCICPVTDRTEGQGRPDSKRIGAAAICGSHMVGGRRSKVQYTSMWSWCIECRQVGECQDSNGLLSHEPRDPCFTEVGHLTILQNLPHRLDRFHTSRGSYRSYVSGKKQTDPDSAVALPAKQPIIVNVFMISSCKCQHVITFTFNQRRFQYLERTYTIYFSIRG